MQKINDFEVVPVKTHDEENYKYKDLLCDKYFRLALFGKPGSGKSTLLYNLINHVKGKNTLIVLISSSVNDDPVLKKLSDLKNVIAFDSMFTEEGTNVLEVIQEDVKENKKEKTKRPETIIILDDIRTNLKNNKPLSLLFSRNRHMHCCFIVSTQYPYDLDRSMRNQTNHFCMFGGFPQKLVNEMHEQIGNTDLNKEQFNELYKEITQIEHTPMYFNSKGEIRCGLNYRI